MQLRKTQGAGSHHDSVDLHVSYPVRLTHKNDGVGMIEGGRRMASPLPA